MKWTLLLICGLLVGSMTSALGEEANALKIELMWSELIPGGFDGNRHTVKDIAHTSTGGLALYGQHKSTETKVQVLGGKGIDWVSLNPSGRVYNIAATSNGSFFLAGSIQQMHGWFSLEKSPLDAYLAHFSAGGDLLWERSFGDVGFQVATDLAVLSNDGALVAVHGQRFVELWAVGPKGETLWRQPIGLQDAAIAVTPSGSTIVAVTMDNAGRDSADTNYSEDLVLSLRDITGNELSRTIVRPDLNRFAGDVSLDVSEDTILIASAWDYFSRNNDAYRPIEVAAYDHAGLLKWRHRPAVHNCDGAPFLLPNGEAVIACVEAFDDKPRHLVLYRYGLAGEVTELRALLPECHQTRYPVAINVVHVVQNVLTVLASRPTANVGEGCTWVGTINIGRG